jgi:hypothetical protein
VFRSMGSLATRRGGRHRWDRWRPDVVGAGRRRGGDSCVAVGTYDGVNQVGAKAPFYRTNDAKETVTRPPYSESAKTPAFGISSSEKTAEKTNTGATSEKLTSRGVTIATWNRLCFSRAKLWPQNSSRFASL